MACPLIKVDFSVLLNIYICPYDSQGTISTVAVKQYCQLFQSQHLQPKYVDQQAQR